MSGCGAVNKNYSYHNILWLELQKKSIHSRGRCLILTILQKIVIINVLARVIQLSFNSNLFLRNVIKQLSKGLEIIVCLYLMTMQQKRNLITAQPNDNLMTAKRMTIESPHIEVLSGMISHLVAHLWISAFIY